MASIPLSTFSLMELLLDLLEETPVPWDLSLLDQQNPELQGRQNKFCKWIMRGNGERRFFHFYSLILEPPILDKGETTTTELSKGPFHRSRVMDNLVRLVNSISMNLLLHFICCKISSLARSGALRNTMMGNKT